MTERDDLGDAFERHLARLPDGYMRCDFEGKPWSVTVNRSDDGRRLWLFAEELGGADVVSFNHYVLKGGPVLKPCEMSSAKVVDFVLGFRSVPETPVAETGS